jgi:hypothetical protein
LILTGKLFPDHKVKSCLLFILFILFSVSCSSQDKVPDIFKKKSPSVFHYYKESAIPGFFDQVFRNHYPAFKEKHMDEYKSLCESHSLKFNDTLNQERFFRLLFFQQMMTSESPINCSQKGALKIPYFWNWVNPNPRSEILSLVHGRTLDKVSAGIEFSKYKSYAFIDRIPSLFLHDLVSEKAGYFHPSCDTIYTFGWCSEREMAFNLLMSFYHYHGKVIVSGAKNKLFHCTI